MPLTKDQSEGLDLLNRDVFTLSGVMETVRLEGWWKPKAANLMAILYSVMLSTGLLFPRACFLLALSVLTIGGIGSFGHIINDWYDVDADAAAGKANLLAGLAAWKRYGLGIALLAIAWLPWLALPNNALSFVLLLLEFALLLTYSIPPFRLKTRPVWSVLADAAYAYSLPAVLAAHTFFLASAQPDNRLLLSAIFFWQSGLGIRHFLNHLALDRDNDLRSGTRTLATLKGSRYIHHLIRRIVLPVELLGFLAYLWIMTGYRRYLVIAVAALFFFSVSFHALLLIGRRSPVLTYRFSKVPLDRLYQDILPLTLLAWLVSADWRFSAIVVGHIVLFYPGGAGAILRLLALPVMMLARPSKQDTAGSARVEPHGERGNTVKIASRPNIAVVNINRAKYTETFIQELVSRLNYNVYYLYGGELPRYDDDHQHFLPYMQTLAQLLEAGLKLKSNHFLRSSIALYLQKKRIRLVLAEFGPVGIEMLSITRDLGIPLVVYFHGYDVFHREALRQYAPGYPALFQQAVRIVGVSEIMLDHLEQLGAPREKLVHLPAFVNLERFPYSDHSAMPPRFLAVGRFAETKSPHLTILAFHKIVQAVPQATLTMVGTGGGGELFEACMILARALGLEDQIEFKGVVSHEEVALEMRRARVFIQHSVTTPENGDMEGKPVAVMEAMASGLPVVTTVHAGIRELIEHNVTGLLVPEYDVDAMVHAMMRLVQDDDLARFLGKNASVAIHQHPLISRHVEILDEMIASAIAGA